MTDPNNFLKIKLFAMNIYDFLMLFLSVNFEPTISLSYKRKFLLAFIHVQVELLGV